MCLIAVAWRVHPLYPLALIANRDELHARPTAAAGPDADAPAVHGGRDLQAGGSWLLVSTRGRLAAVTNVRVGLAKDTAARSRGALVRNFVRGTMTADDYFAGVRQDADAYGRFNLMCWDGDALGFATNHPDFEAVPIAPGVHAMSNGTFDAPWPKSTHATQALVSWLDTHDGRGAPGPEAIAPLFSALAETTLAPDALLPDTGVGPELERMLSPPFVRGERYGTRCSTVVLVGSREIEFVERRFGPDAAILGESGFTLQRSAT